MDLFHLLAAAGLAFLAGVTGLLTSRHLLVVFLSAGLILNAINLNMLLVAQAWGGVAGHVLSGLILALALAQVTIGLAVLIAVRRHCGSLRVLDPKALRC